MWGTHSAARRMRLIIADEGGLPEVETSVIWQRVLPRHGPFSFHCGALIVKWSVATRLDDAAMPLSNH